MILAIPILISNANLLKSKQCLPNCLVKNNLLRFMQAEELAAALKASKGNLVQADATDGVS